MASSASLATSTQAAQFSAVTTCQSKPKSVTQSSFVGTKGKVSSVASLGISNGSSRIVCGVEKPIKDKWSSLGRDISDDQQDITRGKGMVDSLFQGASGFGTQDAIMSSYDYISQGQRTFDWDNTKDGFYIAPAFMDKIVVHLAKNFMKLPNIKVPLILGVWGGKGQGKSFQSELIMSKLGINPIVMSAGELESGNAGEPAKLIRQRYREASDIIKKGKMCCLFINDLDAGAGRMGGTTQYTVNNQMVNATLMNIADNPTNVQLPGIYNKEEIPRVPIIVTGNDFSTLYAPLIRDGRMEKFYWAPTREDRIGVAKGIFRVDNIPENEVVQLVDTFPGQSIDFFGALRARVYDDEVRKWVAEVGVENIGKKLVNSREGPPSFAQPKMTLDLLLKYGWMLVQEQENVKRVQLADEYLSGAALGNANDDADKGYYTGKAAQQFPPPVKEGCADPNAVNFDPTARSDDGSCVYDFSDAPKAAAAEYVQPSLDDIVPIIPKNLPVRGGRGRGGARSRSPSRSPVAAADKSSSSSSNGDFSSYYQEPSYVAEPEADSLDDIVPIIPKNLPVRGGRGRGRARSRSPSRTPAAASQGETYGDSFTSSFGDSTSYSSATEADSLDDIVPIIPKNIPVRGGRGRGRARSRSPTRSSVAVAASNGDYYSAAEDSFDSLDDIVPIIPKNLPVRGGRGRGRARSRSPSRTPAAVTYEAATNSDFSFTADPVADSLDDIVPIIPKNLPVRGGRGRGRARSRSPSRTPAAVVSSYDTPFTAAPESDDYLDSIVPIIPKNLPVRGGRGRGGRARSRSPSRSPVTTGSNGGYSSSFDDSFSAAVISDSLDDIVPIIPKNLPVRGGRGRGRARSRSPSRTPIVSGSSNGGFTSSFEDTPYTVADSLDDIVPIIPKNLPVRGGRGRGRARSRSPARSSAVSTGSSNGSFTSSFDTVSVPETDSLEDIVPIIPKNLPVRGARGRGRARSRSPSRSPVAAVSQSSPSSSSFDSFFPSDYSSPAVSEPETSYFDAPAVVTRPRSASPGPRGRGRGRGGRR